MALFITNSTTSPITLNISTGSFTIPANQTYNATAELLNAVSGDFTLLDTYRAAGTLSFQWSGSVQFPTPGLSVTPGETSQTVATIAGLQALSNPGTGVFTIVQVQSNKAYYIFDSSSSITADGIVVVAPGSGSGRWLRQRWGHEEHRKQTAWYIDAVSGNDENTGTSSGTAIKTVRELALRLSTTIIQSITVTLLNDLPSTDPLSILNLRTEWNTTLSPGTAPVLTVVGQMTTTRTGTFTSAGTIPVPASNLASQATDTSVVSWTAEVGRMLVVTSGAASGSYAWILKDLTSGVVRLSRWQTSAHANASTMPSSSDTYKVVTLTSIPAAMPGFTAPQNDANSSNVIVQNVNFNAPLTPTKESGLTARLDGCKVSGGMTIRTGTRMQLRGTLLMGAYGASEQGDLLSTGSASITGSTSNANNNGSATITDWIFQGGAVQSLDGGFLSLTSVGVFDSTLGLIVVSNGYCGIGTALFGSGISSISTQVRRGGKLLIASGVTPTLTGGTELIFEGAGTAISPLTAGASVPAASTLATWANWAAAPFSRAVVSYSSGAWIYGS